MMQFILTGFTQDLGFRVFAFEGVGENRVRTPFTVRADLNLIRRYGIPIQELPPLCRDLLERCEEREEKRTLIFGEPEMCLYASNLAAAREAAALKKKTHRRPPTEHVGAAWRGPQT